MVGLATVDTWTGATLLTDDPSARFAAAEATCTKVLSLVPNHIVARFVVSSVQIFTKRDIMVAQFDPPAGSFRMNSATARSLGSQIPPSILARADEVIE